MRADRKANFFYRRRRWIRRRQWIATDADLIKRRKEAFKWLQGVLHNMDQVSQNNDDNVNIITNYHTNKLKNEVKLKALQFH